MTARLLQLQGASIAAAAADGREEEGAGPELEEFRRFLYSS